MDATTDISTSVRAFVLDAFLYGDPDADVTDTTDLVERGVVDSMNVLRLVEFMEDTYDIMLEPEELVQLTSIANVTGVIRSKLDGEG